MFMYRMKRYIYENIQNGIRQYLKFIDRKMCKENERFVKAELRYIEKMEKCRVLKRLVLDCRKKTNIWYTEECARHADDIRILKTYDNIRVRENH